MKHKRHHWLEKIQVQFAGAVALAVTFFIIEPMHGRWDPQWPATFVSTGSFGGLLSFAVLVWVLAAFCAVLTISSRPEGALFATLVGAAGISMHSPPIRALFWDRQDSMEGVFLQLIAELFALFVIVVVAIHVVYRVRALACKLCPGWMWKGRITEETFSSNGVDAKTPEGKKQTHSLSWIVWFLSPIRVSFLDQMRISNELSIVSPRQQAKSRKAALTCMFYCLAATMLYSSIMLMLLMQSTQRGQIIFALFASFLLATLIAHQQFATQFSVVSWASALLTGILFYTLAIASSGHSGPNVWIKVRLFARALPIDWMSAGGAGGVLGYWISERIHELRHIDNHAEKESI
ncbi:MAG: hypothetical protein GY794_22135 [bacterium]|nr:hypothetical protein [bacterium]